MRAVASVWPYITNSSTPHSVRAIEPRSDALGRHPPAGLGHEPQRRHVHAVRAGLLEELVGVRDPGDVRDALRHGAAAAKHGSTTDADVSTTPAPAARCEWSTDSP